MADQADGKAVRVRRPDGQPEGEDRVISGDAQLDDEALDHSLRPRRMADFVGQAQV